MSSSIGNLLNPSLGIETVMEPGQSAAGLPQARPLAANVLREAGLEELYAPQSAARLIEQALCPDVGDGELLRPEVFATHLKECFVALQSSDDPVVQNFLNADLRLLLENRELLQAYTGLMIGG